MFDDDDLLSISALQHLEFCRRRCALVHIDGLWAENAQTAEGRTLHERVHSSGGDNVAGVRVARGLRLCSRELGLSGVADVVEFRLVAGGGDCAVPGAVLPDLPGRWLPFPVEYKRGARKPEMSYFVQLCAQGLCLEEMLQTSVPAGALYHGKSRRRQAVTFDDALRDRTRRLAYELHELIAAGRLPPPEPGPKCRFCSLSEKCMPKLPPSRSARDYLARSVAEALARED